MVAGFVKGRSGGGAEDAEEALCFCAARDWLRIAGKE